MSSTSDIQLNHLCWPVPVSMSSRERWHIGRGAAACSSHGLTTFVQISTVCVWCRTALTINILYSFCISLNQTIWIHQALLVSLQKTKLSRLPLFDYYICEMGTQTAPQSASIYTEGSIDEQMITVRSQNDV